jgi:flagellar basal-body rod protein FlgB
LAENVANANTPGFKAQDLDVDKLSDNRLPVVKLRTTSSRHLKGHKNAYKAPVFKTGGELKQNGNDVNLPDQMAKVAKNQDRYNEIIRNYMVTTNLVGTALGQGNN